MPVVVVNVGWNDELWPLVVIRAMAQNLGAPAYVAADYRARHDAAFPIAAPDLDGDSMTAQTARARAASNPHATRFVAALAGRVADGAALLAALPAGTLIWAALPASLTASVPDAHRAFVLDALARFRAWAVAIVEIPPAAEATWNPPQLEYQFDCRVARPGGQELILRLQRAAMPRFFSDTVRPVRPATAILRPGLADDDQQTAPYYVHEEEVPRAGIRIEAGFQRARWYDGGVVAWYGRRKTSGRGEGGSGLRFDAIEDAPAAPKL